MDAQHFTFERAATASVHSELAGQWQYVCASYQRPKSACKQSHIINDETRQMNQTYYKVLFRVHKTRENNGYTGDDDRSHSLYIKNNKQTKMMWLEKT